MSALDREALVERMAEAIGDAWDTDADDDERLRVYARAALAIAEPVVREDEREQLCDILRAIADTEHRPDAQKALRGAAAAISVVAARARKEPIA